MTATTIRTKLYDYIRVANDKKIKAIYHLLENEIEETNEWWKDETFIKELDSRAEALETGADKGVTVAQLKSSLDKIKARKYGK